MIMGKKTATDAQKAGRARSWQRGEDRHASNRARQARQEAGNRAAGGPTPWEMAKAARRERRAAGRQHPAAEAGHAS
jgi:hypothetical protein